MVSGSLTSIPNICSITCEACKIFTTEPKGFTWNTISPRTLFGCSDLGCKLAAIVLELFKTLSREVPRDAEKDIGVYRGQIGLTQIAHLQDLEWLEIFSLPETQSSWPMFPAGVRLEPYTGSEFYLDKVRPWAEACSRSHPLCGKQDVAYFPTRVLDVGDNHDDLIRLIEDCNEKHGCHYICLSHCWGSINALSTTQDTLASRCEGILFDQLPPNYRDAVTLARHFGVRYLWIDSLCIIQDDESDWVTQSSQMHAVYSNSFVTISATRAKDAMSGIFTQRGPKDFCEIPNPFSPRSSSGLFARRKNYHEDLGNLCGSEEDNVLLTRAWAFQEHLVSPRVVFFSTSEMSLQCNEKTHCFCTPDDFHGQRLPVPDLKQEIAQLLSLSQSTDRATNISAWHRIVTVYAYKKLTRDSDALPALSGIAKMYQKIRNTGYLAGLWEDSLVLDMAWKIDGYLNKRPTGYLAPSWSWASVIGGSYSPAGRPGFKAGFDIVEASCSPSTSDPTGKVASGFVRLFGHLIPGHLQIEQELEYKIGFFQTASTEFRISLDAYEDDWRDAERNLWPIYGLYVGSWEDTSGTSDSLDQQCSELILLRQISDSKLPAMQFERVGYSDIHSSSVEVMRDMEDKRQEITII